MFIVFAKTKKKQFSITTSIKIEFRMPKELKFLNKMDSMHMILSVLLQIT